MTLAGAGPRRCALTGYWPTVIARCMNSAETRTHAASGIMVSQERRDQFVAALGTLGGAAGNGRLREQLEWDDDQ